MNRSSLTAETADPYRRAFRASPPGRLRSWRWTLLAVLLLAAMAGVLGVGQQAGAQTPMDIVLLTSTYLDAGTTRTHRVGGSEGFRTAVRFSTGLSRSLITEVVVDVARLRADSVPTLQIFSSTEMPGSEPPTAAPDAALYTFEAPSTFGTGLQTFTAPSPGFALAPNTSYWIVASGSGAYWHLSLPNGTVASHAGPGSAGGWSFHGRSSGSSTAEWSSVDVGTYDRYRLPRMEIKGSLAPGLTGATVNPDGDQIELTFQPAFVVPTTGAAAFWAALAARFSVTVDSSSVSVTADTTNSDAAMGKLVLNVSPSISPGQTVVLTYTDPTAGDDDNVLESATGVETPTFTSGQGGVPQVVNAASYLLVSNTGQTAGAPLTTDATRESFAQSFKTGGNINGYFLSSVELGLSAEPGVTVEVALWSNTDSIYEPPGDRFAGSPVLNTAYRRVVTLVGPSSIDADVSTLERFTTNGDVLLLHDTTYWIVVTRTAGAEAGLTVGAASSPGAVDSESRDGFSLGRRVWARLLTDAEWRDGDGYADGADTSMKIRLSGVEAESRPPGPYVTNRNHQTWAAPARTGASASRYATSFIIGGGFNLDRSRASSFAVTSVVLSVAAETGVTPRVAIHADYNGSPDESALPGGTLTAPVDISRDLASPARAEFAASAPLSLDPGTTYWVVLDVASGSGGLSVGTTASAENDGPYLWNVQVSHGAHIVNPLQAHNGTMWSDDPDGRSFRMAVNGTTDTSIPVGLFIGPPQVGVGLAPTILDRSGWVHNESWQWQRGDTSEGPFIDIPPAEGGTSAVYWPTADDLGRWLQATVTYDNAFGPAGSLSAVAPQGVLPGTTTVSNAGQNQEVRYTLVSPDLEVNSTLSVAQAFTTGSESLGYVLNGVRLGINLSPRSRHLSDPPPTEGSTMANNNGGGSGVTVSFGASEYTVVESDDPSTTETEENNVTVTVELSAAQAQSVEIPITATNEGGASGEDYSGVPETVTFESGQTTTSFVVTATDDAQDDDGESVELGFGTLPPGVSPGAQSTATVTIRDDDAVIDALSWALHADDGGLPARMPLFESIDISAADLDADVHTFEELDHPGFVLEPNTRYWVVISSTLLVEPLDNDGPILRLAAVTDFDKNVFLYEAPAALDPGSEPGWSMDVPALASLSGWMAPEWGTHSNELELQGRSVLRMSVSAPPVVEASFGQPSHTIAESDDAFTTETDERKVTVTVKLSQAPKRTVTIPIIATEQDGATSDDYSGVPESVTFEAGETEQKFTVVAISDEVPERGEAIELSFGTLQEGVMEGTPVTTTITITEDIRSLFDGALRLMDGMTYAEDGRLCDGRVEIYYNGAWGTICDDYWSRTNVDVACRALGFAGGASGHEAILLNRDTRFMRATEYNEYLRLGICPEEACGAAANQGVFYESYFGSGSGEILLDDVECRGTEAGLLECPRNEGESNCSLSETAGLRCLKEAPPRVVYIAISDPPGGNGRYDSGETVEITLVWSVPVVVATPVGNLPPKVWVGFDDNSTGVAPYVRGSGTTRTVFAYTLSEGSYDDIEVLRDTLREREGTIRSADLGLPAVLKHKGHPDIIENASLAEIVAAPTLRGPGARDTWGQGDTIEVTFNFDLPVEVDITDGTPSVAIYLGGTAERYASYSHGSGSNRLVFSYSLTEEDGTRDAVLVQPNSLELNGGAVTDVYFGNDAELGHSGGAQVLPLLGFLPGVQHATVDGATLTLTYNETLDTGVTLPLTAFAVQVNESPRTISAVDVSGSNVTLTLASAVASGDSVTVDYVQPDGPDFIRDTRGRRAVSFSGLVVANNTPSSSNQISQGNNPATGGPGISGSPSPGETLTADTSGIADADGLTNAVFSYQWVRQDLATLAHTNIEGETSLTYVVTAEDEGKAIKVRVTFTDDAGNQESLESFSLVVSPPLISRQQRGANSPATGEPYVTGTATTGETLIAEIYDIADEDGLANAAFSYQWVRHDLATETGTDIKGATGETYAVTAGDEGRALRVRVEFTDDAGNRESLLSAPTGAVTGETSSTDRPYGLEAVVQDGAVVLTWEEPGLTREGADDYRILRHRPELGEPDPLVYVEYTDTSATSYTDTGVDPGVLYVYRVQAVIDFFGDVGEASDPVSIRTPVQTASPPVTPDEQDNTPAAGRPTVGGTAQVGETLTADTSAITDDDGLSNASFRYMWLAGDADIAAATGSTYTVAPEDKGKAIKVRVDFTDDAGNEESVTSEATQPVVAAPEPGLSLSDLDVGDGQEVLAAALIAVGDRGRKNDETQDRAWYATDTPAWNASGELRDGSLSWNGITLTRVAYFADTGVLRFNEADPGFHFGDSFGEGGVNRELTIWVKTDSGTVSFLARDHVLSSGSGYINFSVPEAGRATLATIAKDDLIIVAVSAPDTS